MNPVSKGRADYKMLLSVPRRDSGDDGVIFTEPLILVRIPLKDGSLVYTDRWADIIQASVALLREHGVSDKEVWNLAHMSGPEDVAGLPEDDDRIAVLTDLEAAFAGDPTKHSSFHLYTLQAGAFVSVRQAGAPGAAKRKGQ